MRPSAFLLAGYATTNQAVAKQLLERGHRVLVADDGAQQWGNSEATQRARNHAASLGLELFEQPSATQWAELVASADVVVPTPGLPEAHLVFLAATEAGVSVISEFDLAQQWDDRPHLAVTGTNGKTTVTLMVAAMLEAAGIATCVAGNTDMPLVAAINNVQPQVFVVEASSFRLGYSSCYRPQVGAWLNFAADHLDSHSSMDSYRSAKAAIWRGAGAETTAVVNLDDPVVVDCVPQGSEMVTFGHNKGDFRLADGALWAGSEQLAELAELQNPLTHEVSNLLAAAAVATTGGVTAEAVRQAMLDWKGLEHRVQHVGTHAGVRYYNDSKATSPHAVCAAVRAQASTAAQVVLIAGGRNKGLDLKPLAEVADALRVVIAIGEAAIEVEQAFSGRCLTVVASSMLAAVRLAAENARSGEVVLLSPGCASFDWYGSYVERGKHFCRLVDELIAGTL